MRKIQKLSERQPSNTSSEDEVEYLIGKRNLNASPTETNSTKLNTILSIPSNFPGEIFTTDIPTASIIFVIPRNC